MSNKDFQKNLLMHVFIVTIFLIVPMVAFVRPPGEPFFALSKIFVQDTIANFVLLCFFYFNYYLLLPRYFLQHKYGQYILFMIIFLSFAFTLPFIGGKYFASFNNSHQVFAHTPFDENGPASQPPSIAAFVWDEFRRHLHSFFTAIFFSFLLKTREFLAELKEQKLEAELSSLKTQINPHFLFNTLNSIYSLSVKKDDKVPDAIINLSGLMRYVIKDAHGYTIPLKKEMEYLENYIELQKARLGNTATIVFNCKGEPGSKEIAPLILITYIENAIKYGVNPDVDDCHVTIEIDITDKAIRLYTSNKKVERSRQLESTGIGMKNTVERLQHLYPGKYDLKIDNSSDRYSVTLILETA